MSFTKFVIAWVVVAGCTGFSSFADAQGTPATGPPAPSSTTSPILFTPEIPIPGLFSDSVTITGTSIVTYIRAIFIYFIWTVGILATVMVIYGGIKWVAAAGNPGRINDARDIVNNAIIGVVIALVSVVLLNIINPNLISFRGIELANRQKLLFAFMKEVLAETGEIQSCPKQFTAGEPSKVCSGIPTDPSVSNPYATGPYGCQDLNDLAFKRTREYQFQNVDAFAIKAIVQIESPKYKGQPYSGPEGNNGPGYGLGQFKVAMVSDSLRAAHQGSYPNECNPSKKTLDSGDGQRLSNGCRKWLDDRDGGVTSGLGAQVGMIAYYYGYMLSNKNCINGSLALAAAGYNQGLGGAKDAFCNGTTYKDPVKREQVKQNAIAYINKFKQAYTTTCTAGR